MARHAFGHAWQVDQFARPRFRVTGRARLLLISDVNLVIEFERLLSRFTSGL